MLIVDYKKTYGYCLMQATDHKHYLKVNLYKANCDLFAMVWRGQKEDQLVGFFNDMKHLKNCFKPDDPIYTRKSVKKWVIFTNLKSCEKVVKIIAESGAKVELKKHK